MAAVRCNAVRDSAAIAERCWSPRYIDLLKPLLRPPEPLQHASYAWSAAFRVRACRLARLECPAVPFLQSIPPDYGALQTYSQQVRLIKHTTILVACIPSRALDILRPMALLRVLETRKTLLCRLAMWGLTWPTFWTIGVRCKLNLLIMPEKRLCDS